MLIVDLFCGVGGVSTGAKMARGRVALAVDVDSLAARGYVSLVGGGAFQQAELGGDLEEAAEMARAAVRRAGVDPASGEFHVHASPPCKMLSSSATLRRKAGLTHAPENLKLTAWSLDLIQLLRPRTWSIEQVPAPMLRQFYNARSVPHALVDASEYGVAQARKRVIAAPVEVLERLATLKRSLVTPRAALARFGVVPRGSQIALGTDNTPTRDGRHRPIAAGEYARSLDVPSYTVTGKSLKWVNINDGVAQFSGCLDSASLAALQGFPRRYMHLRRVIGETSARKMVADSVPPPVAAAIIAAAGFVSQKS
tara:strand:+ start:7022 stop:7954 length:933 start_codon:yes stop_codon:yes gene_type:complete